MVSAVSCGIERKPSSTSLTDAFIFAPVFLKKMEGSGVLA